MNIFLAFFLLVSCLILFIRAVITCSGRSTHTRLFIFHTKLSTGTVCIVSLGYYIVSLEGEFLLLLHLPLYLSISISLFLSLNTIIGYWWASSSLGEVVFSS